MRVFHHQIRQNSAGFTLVELLVAITVFLLLMSVIGGVMNQTNLTIRAASSQIDLFQSARQGFNTLAQNLSQATLNTYWDYDSDTAPTTYIRKSDLHFLIVNPSDLQLLTAKPSGSFGIFFQAPRAYSTDSLYNQTSGLLNAVGYYVEYGDDLAFRPTHVTASRWRYRLMQAIQPTNSLGIFKDPTSGWAKNMTKLGWPIADNVIALILWPRLSIRDDGAGNKITQDYTYDSRGKTDIQKAQSPPVVQVTLVAISESSAVRLNSGETPPSVITNALKDKFTNVAQYSVDLGNLKDALQAAHIEYKEFTTTVSIRESKWSGIP